jgi:putative ABC transport system ATP-binding protein
LDVNALAEIRCRQVGFVFQRFHLMPRLNALDNVMLPMRLARIAPAEREQRAAALLKRIGLDDRFRHRPAELSGGEQQRVAIARALANSPSMILADEPTGNLDSRTGKQIMNLLEELVDEGHLLIIVTHDEAISRRAQRVIRLSDGRIVG